MGILSFIAGILIGAIAAALVLKSVFESKKARAEERASILDSSLQKTNSELLAERQKASEASSNLSRANAELASLKERSEEQKALLTSEFKNFANEILEEKSRKFTEQNRENIGAVLTPLQEKIKEFERTVNDAYGKETRERASLAEQIKHLTTLNQQMTKDAADLTNALKGQSKTQGDWGEGILEKILESSGLVKGVHYDIQRQITDRDGNDKIIDAIVNLPDNKHIVIDSKVSLNAYVGFCSADDPASQKEFLDAHLGSIEGHIKELNKKDYWALYEIQSPDFVLMFVPIESAFAIAVKNDPLLFDKAFSKDIVIVTTSTLLATLKTIAYTWKQEKQSRNALDIAEKSGDLYDKFVAFIDDMGDIGTNLGKAEISYKNAMNKLSTGKGNLIKRAEELKKMGAKAQKSLPPELVEKAGEETELLPPEDEERSSS